MEKEEEKKFIECVLNHQKKAMEDFYRICESISTTIAKKFYDNDPNQSDIKKDLADELYLYILKDEKILRGFKGNGPLGGFLFSVAKNYFSSFRIFEDPALTKIKKRLNEKREKEEKIIMEFDKETLLFHSFLSDPKPKDFKSEPNQKGAVGDYQEADNKNVHEEEDVDADNDLIVDIKKALDVSTEKTTLSRCELVWQTLDKMPQKEALIIRKSYLEECKSEDMAKELNMTVNALYNLRSKARKLFQSCFNNLIKELYE